MPAGGAGQAHGALGREPAQHASQQARNGAVAAAGGRGDPVDPVGGAPQLAVGPGIGLAARGAAEAGEALGRARPQVEPARAGLDHADAAAHRQRAIGEPAEVGDGVVLDQIGGGVAPAAGEVVLPFERDGDFLHAGQEQIHPGQCLFQYARPVGKAGRRMRIGHRHVQGGSDIAVFRLAHDPGQLGPTVGIHPPHQRGIAEVEQAGPADQIEIDVLGAERVVGAGAVQEHAVDARGREDDAERGDRARRGPDGAGGGVAFQQPLDHQAQFIIADAAEGGHRMAEPLQRQTGVGDLTAEGDRAGLDHRQAARREDLLDPHAAGLRDDGGDVEADVAGGDGVDGLVHRQEPVPRKVLG
ncbi:MAG: hypothetical protein BWZ08_02636 [candidate division BRC1 bacterium ADurb.BinA292]|nr:MAG: hypothetical protein BWZ08_02636 [candidate division BRC1 bacterium ADurb.BinA292]